MAKHNNKGHRLRFSKEEDERLINEVAQQPALYDPKQNLYKDQNVRDNIWEEISQVVSKNVEECKKRWKSLKDVYWKKKKEGKHRTGEAAKRTTKWEHMDALAFLDRVTTYRQTVSNVTETNEEDNNSSQAADEVVDEDVVENRDETLEGEASQDTETMDEMAESQYRQCGGNTVESTQLRPPMKRKTTNEKLLDTIKKRAESRSVLFKKLESAIEDKPHPIKLFFASMAETVMLFPPALAARAKMRVMEVVHELELENYGVSSTLSYDSLSRVPTPATSLSSTSSYHPTRRESDTTTSYVDSCYSAPSSVEPPRVYEDCADLFSSTTFQ